MCKSCMGERAKGRSHKCGRKSALSNSLQLLNESFTSPQQVAHKCIRAGVNKSSQFSLHGQTGGSPTEINVGKPSAPTVSVTADDMLHQHSAFHFSSRRNIKNARAWKARIEKSGCKVSLPSFFFFCFVCIKAEHIFHLHCPGCEFLRYVWGPEAGGTAHLQSQGEGEAANPHRPVPQGFEPWTFGSKVQYPTPELPALPPLCPVKGL